MANVANDTALLGVDWTVSCASALPVGTPLPPGQVVDTSCGFFTPAHTIAGPLPGYAVNGAGYVTFYTAPAAPPKGGTVTLYAAATADHTRYSVVTLTINGLPIAINFAQVPPATLAVNSTAQFQVALSNDYNAAGANWTVSCGSSNCGSFSPAQTASGIATTYTAPATAPAGGSVTITATSVADATKSVSATVGITADESPMVSGTSQAARHVVSGAQVTLYAAKSSATVAQTATNLQNTSAPVSAMTNADGNFAIPYGYTCPAPDTPMYLVSQGGNAGGGINDNLVLMAALGPCSQLSSSRFVLNEATTIAAAYSLSAFFTDIAHIGSSAVSSAALAKAFATANDLVDPVTGLPRDQTLSAQGVVPRAKLGTLSNSLSACAATGGSSPNDGGVCDQLIHAATPGLLPLTMPRTTLQAALNLVRNPMASIDGATLYRLAVSASSFAPTLDEQPAEWTLPVIYAHDPGGLVTSSQPAAIDAAADIWVRAVDGSSTEFVGAASGTHTLEPFLSLATGGKQAQP